MNEILETRLFALLSEPSNEATNEEMQSAYGNFVEHVGTVSLGSDYTIIYRTLNITRAELVFLSTQIQHGQGKKCA